MTNLDIARNFRCNSEKWFKWAEVNAAKGKTNSDRIREIMDKDIKKHFNS